MMARKFILLLLFASLACGPKKVEIDPKSKSDAEIYQLGLNYMKENDWAQAREAFRTVFENFPQSDYRIPAKLGHADAFFEEGRQASLLIAYQEYQDFISLFPFSPKACYAQLRMGLCYHKMMEKPDRDQTNTKKALDEFKKVVDNYPNCAQFAEAQKYLLETYSHLAEHEYLVAFYYHRTGRDIAAVERIKAIFKNYPEAVHQPKHYLTIARSLEKLAQTKEACTYYDQLLQKWPQSEEASHAQQGKARTCK
jgi:outer membrane protein assembly factor BamD